MVKGRRTDKKGKFVKPTSKEIMADRQEFMDSYIVGVIHEAQEVIKLQVKLRYMEELIKWRKIQLNSDDIKEKFNGGTYPKGLFGAALDLSITEFNEGIRVYNTLHTKFLKEYKFTEDDMKLVRAKKFDFEKWRKKYLADQEKQLKESLKKRK